MEGVCAVIPTVDFYGTLVTRLILGDNPFNGHSYITDVHSGDEMMDYYTANNIIKTLFAAEECGINTYMALADPFILRIIRQYRNEGGKMNIMFQSYPPVDLEINIRQMMACDPIAIYHQGGSFDLLVEENKIDTVHERLELIRNSGVKAGLATHVPEVLLRAETENWGIDFYMACLYNARRTQRGRQSGFITGKSKDDLVFFPDDPPIMYEAVRNVKKPCIVFKLFAGGQIFHGKPPAEVPVVIESVYTNVYENIKQNDMTCIGVFQKNKDELRENADIVRKVLAIQ